MPAHKRLPPLSDLTGGPRKPPQPKTSDQLLAIAMQWNRAAGGQ